MDRLGGRSWHSRHLLWKVVVDTPTRLESAFPIE
jgi:hypothetical protein